MKYASLFFYINQKNTTVKNWLHKLHIHRYFLLFILLFAYAQSVYNRILVRQEINAYIFTPEAAIFWLPKAVVLFTIIFFFIKKWQKSDVFSTKEMLKIASSSMIVYILIMLISGFLIAYLFDNIERNFNRGTLTINLFSDFLDGLIYGSFFLVYYYYRKNKNHQQQLANYHHALSESKIFALKTQLNPHFLFNNLNVLDQLIEEDKNKASEFLNEFAEIYRYVLKSSDRKLINLNDELDFAEQYFRLIQHKYGNAYQLAIKAESKTGLIVPLTLQLLIENAVQHNVGTEENPILISVILSENIRISNNTNLKKNAKPSSRLALGNLKAQYKLLTPVPIEIQQENGVFSVIIPLIHKEP